MSSINKIKLSVGFLLCFVIAGTPGYAAEQVTDSPMYTSPDLPTPHVIYIFPEEAKGLWLKALEQPDADTKCKVADAIALAQRRGVKGLEMMVAPLIATLDKPEQHAAVRLAVAQALIALNAKQAAPNLFRSAQAGGSDLRNLVEPALAHWDYRPARDLWIARLADQANATQRSTVVAIQALATVREEKAADRLLELTLAERTPASIRLEAALALGTIRPAGLEKDAESLAADRSSGGVIARLAAVRLLLHHQSDAANQFLQRLVLDKEPAVGAVAAGRLMERDPKLLLPAIPQLLASSDAQLRSFAVDVLFQQPTDQRIQLLSDRLDDVDPDVRIKARNSLVRLATEKGLRKPVIEQATRMLATREWRGLEQAAIVLVQLDHKPAAQRLMELLNAERPEVNITAAWGVRRLAVVENLPAVLSHVESQLRHLQAGARKPDPAFVILDFKIAQLNQFLGLQKYVAAENVLQEFIPRIEKVMAAPIAPESRAAAIWALGLIHEGQTIPEIVTAVERRLNDTNSMPPEDPRVRWMAAITLGRLRAKGALPSLQKHYTQGEPSDSKEHNACGWGIAQITGEPMKPPRTVEKLQRDWFLAPYR